MTSRTQKLNLSKVPDQLKTRALAVMLVLEVQSGTSLQHRLEPALSLLSPQDRGFTHELLFGSLRHFTQLRFHLKSCLSKPLKSNVRWIESLLIVGAYQLAYMSTPARAVVHSMVEIVKALGPDHMAGLVNGVLRSFLRELEKHEGQLAPLQIHDYLHEDHWLYQQLFQDWRKEYFPQIMQSFQQQPSLYLRLNSSVDVQSYMDGLAAQSIQSQQVANHCYPVPQCIQLEQSQKVSDLPGYADGVMSVQDYSAQVAVQILADLKLDSPQLRVLDACAAPGGKTAALIDLMPKGTQIHSIELEPARAERIRENMKRLALPQDDLDIICGDLLEPQPIIDHVAKTHGYDIILLDAPCSGTGVIGRHPDILWCRRQEDIQQLVEIQRKLLLKVEHLLKPGGYLLYATCSILKAENTNNISWLIKESESQLEMVTLDESIGIQQEYGNQRLPLPNSYGDGFYYALLRKPQ